jgi:hypothetical protein
LRRLYEFLRSIKLAVALILIIAGLAVFSTVIPQGQEAAFYAHRYGTFWGRLVVGLGFHEFFRSALFLLPVALFFVNLSICTVDRMARRARRGARRRHGPDLVHVGLLVLIVGALLSVFGRQQGMAYLGQGDEIRLPGGYSLRLLSCSYEQWPDGRPKDWISTVQVSREGAVQLPSCAIEVNRPLKIGGIKVYQASFAREDTAVLKDAAGEVHHIRSGQGFGWEGGTLLFRGLEGSSPEPGEDTAVFEKWEGQAMTASYRVAVPQAIAGCTLVALSSRELTGLKAVKDPGFIPVVAALAMFAAGLTLTLIQKRKDQQI